MKKVLVIFLAASILLIQNVFGAESIGSTNADGINILPAVDSATKTGYIKFADGSEEAIDDNYTALFINGSLIKDAKVLFRHGTTLVPVRIISEYFDSVVKWDLETNRISISNGNDTIVMEIGNKHAKINDREVLMDEPPVIFEDFIYVPVRFISEALGVNIEYSDGKYLETTYIIPRIRHIMVSGYSESLNPITSDQSVKIVKQQLITAYENRYGEYTPDKRGDNKDGDYWYDIIEGLEVSRENDRYYVIPVVYDFWVDKYTGDVYTFYNGQLMVISKFNPLSPGALAFAG